MQRNRIVTHVVPCGDAAAVNQRRYFAQSISAEQRVAYTHQCREPRRSRYAARKLPTGTTAAAMGCPLRRAPAEGSWPSFRAGHFYRGEVIRRRSFAEYWKYFVTRFNDVHAFGYDFAGSERIWMKFRKLRVYCVELALTDFGRDPRRSESGRPCGSFVFFVR